MANKLTIKEEKFVQGLLAGMSQEKLTQTLIMPLR